MSVVSPTSRFAYKSIRLHRGRFAYMTKSFRLHGPSRFAYTCKSKYFVKIDEYHCLQSAEESYLTVFPDNSEILQLLTEEGNDFWFELSGGPRNGDSTV